MTARRCLLAAATLLMLAGSALAPPAFAQDDGGRLERLEKQVRELRAIVFQGRDTGQPVEVKLAGPDPAIATVEQRLDGVDGSLRDLHGQLEVITHDSDEAHHNAETLTEQNGALRAQVKDLSDRLARLEAQLAPGAALGGAGGQIPPPPTDALPPPPISERGPAGARGSDATAAAQAADHGQLGGPASAPETGPPPAPPPEAVAPDGPAEAYRAARARVTSGDYAGASDAFQAYVTRYPSAKNLSEAYYWKGESDYAREDFQDATPAYARALKGWPKIAWAGDATVKLARALAETSRNTEACAALAEFDHRYKTASGAATRARADAVSTRAKCGG